jgi:hypothetical protein
VSEDLTWAEHELIATRETMREKRLIASLEDTRAALTAERQAREQAEQDAERYAMEANDLTLRLIALEQRTEQELIEVRKKWMRRVEQAERERNIMALAIPLEDELADRIDEACKHLAMQDGFTLDGIARLLIDTQRRMAVDWVTIGDERRQREQVEQERDRLQARVTALEAAMNPQDIADAVAALSPQDGQP